EDGDNVTFRSSSGRDAEAIFIGLNGVAAGVEIGSMTITGANSGEWKFSGGDITGAGKLIHSGNRQAWFYQDNLSFTGGTELNGDDSQIQFRPQTGTTGTQHWFGTGDITLGHQDASFQFRP